MHECVYGVVSHPWPKWYAFGCSFYWGLWGLLWVHSHEASPKFSVIPKDQCTFVGFQVWNQNFNYNTKACNFHIDAKLLLFFLLVAKWLLVFCIIGCQNASITMWFDLGLLFIIVRTYVELIRTYVIINSLILWQNALYL